MSGRKGGGFTFKRFDVRQDGAAMKVGTDGVLLGAWCAVKPGMRRVLDIGTGTGLIALMLAQRTEAFSDGTTSGARIDAVEIDPVAADQARRNADASPWPDRIAVVCDSVQHFAAVSGGAGGSYDLVVSNPPYFTEALLCPDAARTAARHTTQLDYDDLLDAAERLLAPEGRLAVVLPADRADRFIAKARVRCLCLARRTEVRSKLDAAPKRALLEFRNALPGACADSTPDVPHLPGLPGISGFRTGCEAVVPLAGPSALPERSTLVIASGEGYTEEYRALTRDFYLSF